MMESDTFGVAEFFYEHAEIEDAGSGLVRIVRYIKRHGVLIPICSTVCPAVNVVSHGEDAGRLARKILKEGSTHH